MIHYANSLVGRSQKEIIAQRDAIIVDINCFVCDVMESTLFPYACDCHILVRHDKGGQNGILLSRHLTFF